MTKIKICGITDIGDALLAVEFGAEMIGFNFYKESPRYIDPAAVRKIIEQLNGNISTVGVFVNESIDRICSIARDSRIDIVQLHGDETVDDAERVRNELGLDVIKAFRIGDKFDEAQLDGFQNAALLLDGSVPGHYGGTGTMANWETARRITSSRRDVFLAGGLSPYNVAEAVQLVRPFAVDVASGVELSPGKKDRKKVAEFVANVREAQ